MLAKKLLIDVENSNKMAIAIKEKKKLEEKEEMDKIT